MTPAAPPPAPRHYGRWRAMVLLGVHLLIGLHIAHWLVAGRSLAPLEFNEVMHTLELGLVTAGFLLMATAVLATAVFGRWFCGWACHLLALQDLCSWLLARVGITARPLRSRTLRTAPMVVMAYMFLWPQAVRLWRGDPLPALRVAGEGEAWASFVTDDFWRNLPGPWITSLTLLICGFAVVYLLGSRAFCFAGCPYGAVFGLVERLAPGRIRLRGDCSDCGRCTAVCQSGIWVHEEVRRFGHVVDPNCLRDLDCVQACPDGALAFGFGRPAGLTAWLPGARRRGFAWSIVDDLLAAAAMLLTILVFRGLYGAVPFLMAVGLGAAAAALVVLTRRLLTMPHVAMRGVVLRRDGRWTRAGVGCALLLIGAGLFWGHSAVVRWHEAAGLRAFAAARAAMDPTTGSVAALRTAVADGILHHERVEQWGWWNPVDHDRRLASLHAWAGTPGRAEPCLRRVLARIPDDHEARLRLAAVLAGIGRLADSMAELETLAASHADGGLPMAVQQGAVRLAERLQALAQDRGEDALLDAARSLLASLQPVAGR